MFSFTTLLLFASPASATDLIRRQDQSSAYATATFPPFEPNGRQDSDSSLESTIPIQCNLGCFIPYGTYYFCFVADTLPGENGGPVNETQCEPVLCQQGIYDELSACLNCIIANGDERPFGYHANTSITAIPTGGYASQNAANGLTNLTLANAILKNVTDKCASLSSAVTGESTITASPTTTGPYFTSWTSGQDLTITQWTGLTAFTSGLEVFTESRVTTLYSDVAAATTTTGTTSMPASTGNSAVAASSNTASMAAASASPTSAAGRMIESSGLGALAGVLVGLAVMLI